MMKEDLPLKHSLNSELQLHRASRKADTIQLQNPWFHLLYRSLYNMPDQLSGYELYKRDTENYLT